MGARMMKPGKRSSAAFGLSPGERALGAVNVFLLTIIGLMMVLPFLNTVAKSFSSNNAITTGKVIFTPVDFQLGTYKYVTGQSQFWDSLRVSVLITLLGTAGAMTISCLTAYPLSKTWLYGRKPVILFFVFTMLFSGGMAQLPADALAGADQHAVGAVRAGHAGA